MILNDKKWVKPIIKHGKMTEYNYIVQYPEKLKIGKNFDIGEFTYINSISGVIIDDYVQIGSHCSIYSNSTIDKKSGPIHLKKNCKIGSHSTIMPNVIIGENSVVGAYSFVNQNVPDNEMWVGIPIKFKMKLE